MRYKKAERDWNRAAYHDARAEYRAAAMHYGVVAHDYSDTSVWRASRGATQGSRTFRACSRAAIALAGRTLPEADKLKPLIDKAAKPQEATATKPAETQLR